jgi:hypothetical protein
MIRHLNEGRVLCVELQKQIKPTCDLILDGCLEVDGLAATIYAGVSQH